METPETIVVDWLVSSLARRMFGAVDLGLIKCLAAPPDQYARWAGEHFGEPLRALALVTGLAVAELMGPPPTDVLQGISTWASAFAAALVRLGGFRSLPADVAFEAAGDVSRSWGELRDCIEELRVRLGLRTTFFETMGPERERDYRALLARLPDDIMAARGEARP